MKIKITGKKNLIKSASLDDSNDLVCSLFINKENSVKLKHMETTVNSLNIFYKKKKEKVIVALIAEDERDNEILDRLIFKSVLKNYGFFIFVSSSLLSV